MTDFKILLEKFNSFVEDTHIRKYCSEICKGDCCSANNCIGKLQDFKQCRTNLACTSYMCYNVESWLHLGFEYEKFMRLMYCKRKIADTLYIIFKHDMKQQADEWPKSPSKNIYFTPYSLIKLDINTHFPNITKEEIKAFKKIMDKKIRLKLDRHHLKC